VKGFAILVVIVLVIVAVVKGSSSSHHSSSASSDSCNENCQAEKTPCSQWLRMEASDQEAMSSALITALDAKDTSDSFAAEFAADISTDCEAGPTLKVSEVAAALAALDTDDFN
jgi:MFS superfamily sulfate permease-like transporter